MSDGKKTEIENIFKDFSVSELKVADIESTAKIEQEELKEVFLEIYQKGITKGLGIDF